MAPTIKEVAKLPGKEGLISMFLVMAGGAWLFGHAFGLGVFGIFLAQALDEFIRGIISLIRWFSNKWQNKSIVKDDDKYKVEEKPLIIDSCNNQEQPEI